MRISIPVIAALAAGGYFLSTRMHPSRSLAQGPSRLLSTGSRVARESSRMARAATRLPRDGSSLPRVRFESGDGPMLSVRDELVVRPPRPGLGMIAALAAGGLLAWSQLKKSGSHTEETIELEVPVSTAYNQWTQFEEFPRFMESVEQVKQIDDTHLHWRANVAGKTKEWDAEITEQIPDQRIAWRSTSGVQNSGVVTFKRVGVNRTKVKLQMDYEPETATEKLGDAVGAVKLTAKGNLRRFKDLVEKRGVETGAWRGTVAQGQPDRVL